MIGAAVCSGTLLWQKQEVADVTAEQSAPISPTPAYNYIPAL
jgi:hypothetical protein